MEDYALDIMIGKGPSARSIRLDLPKFTLIGATTRAGMLTSPLRDRFGISFRLELYTPEELAVIITRSARIMKIDCDRRRRAGDRLPLARHAPHRQPAASSACATIAQVRGSGRIDADIAREALDMLEIDELGLDRTDRAMLETMIKKFGGGPVGLDTLAAITGEDGSTIEDVYEPYLLQLGFIMRTPRGRVATPLAYEHLGLTAPLPPVDGAQIKLDI